MIQESDRKECEACGLKVPEKPRDKTRTVLKVNGMNCQNCARKVRETISAFDNVSRVDVDLSGGSATIYWRDIRDKDVNQIISALKKTGYSATEVAQVEDTHEHGLESVSGWKTNILIGLLVFIPLMVGEWFLHAHDKPWFRWTAFVGALIVQVVCGKRFYAGAWNQLRRFSANMDTLVALGSSAAFGYSVWALFTNQPHLYFMEAVGIITLISIGHWLEARMSQKAGAALRELMNLSPSKARLLVNNKEVEVAVNELKPGDHVVIKPGDRVPTDGEIVEGVAFVDESMLTGESLPVEKKSGSKVFAGTINQDGVAIVRVEAIGEETALWRIIELVRKAQESRADIQRLADKVSNIFVPVVIVVALAAGLWWGLDYESAKNFHQTLSAFLWQTGIPQNPFAAALIHIAAVLIIACPCAMGLATPVALMAGTSVAARRGILIRDSVALEKTGKITCIVFDKTGTLTEGKLSISSMVDVKSGGTPSVETLEIIRKMTCSSNHPASRALCVGIQKILKVNEKENASAIFGTNGWREIRGHGIEMELTGDSSQTKTLYRLGSFQWLESCAVKIPNNIKVILEDGGITVGFSKNDELVAYFVLEDTLKQGIREVIASLERNGLKVYMVTGDNRKSARRIAEQTGIEPERVFAEVKPEEKSGIIKSLQAQGERVAFVGDGINDAPALETANLGIAVSQASDIAREAADIILLKSDVHVIPEALGLARATLRTIKQNLFWAFFYNAAAVPLAALGFLSPIVCAAAMGVSDVVVIGNALRLNRWKYRG